ncbi:hypothetical protein [Prosthecobacter sp.]|uniref:hypothetical protein n=1 Tax=Prosthecobacter sp. TaxID=1965333 RepID=UPI003783F857
MSKVARISRYFADDKDICDLISQGAVTSSKLTEVLRQRGTFVSSETSKENLITYFQRLQFSWPQLADFLEILDRPEREDRFTNCRIDASSKALTIDATITAMEKVKAERGAKYNEIYKINKIDDKSAVLTVEYVEADFSKTRLRQKDEKTLNFRVDITKTGIQVRHQAAGRGHEIMNDVEQHLQPSDDSPPPTRREIIVTGLGSEQRSKFFIELARGIEGYNLSDQHGLRVDKPKDDVNEDDDDDTDNPHLEKQGRVNRAVLEGDSLLSSAEYQDYSKRGYSVSRLGWIAEAENKTLGIVEFSAEFQNGPDGTGFKYGVLGKWDVKKDGELAKTRRAVTPAEKNRLLKLIEESAYRALDKVSSEKLELPPKEEAP